MTRALSISLRQWRITRLPFNAYLALTFAACALPFIIYPQSGEMAQKIGDFLLLSGLCGVAFLVVPLSMRLRDAGRSPLWPVPLLIGYGFLAWGLVGALASASGAPRGGADPVPSPWYPYQDVPIYVLFGATALILLYAVFMKSHEVSL